MSRRKLNESKEKIRFLNTEIKSIKTLLEKSSNNWIKFKDSFDSLQKWLNDQEKIADLPKVNPIIINQIFSKFQLKIYYKYMCILDRSN